MILAKRAYPKCRIEIEGEGVNLKNVSRYAVFSRHMQGSSARWFVTSDLNTLSEQAKQGGESLPPVAFHVIVDFYDIADELQSRQIRPYFTEVEDGKS
jgi:hypothetical protein